MATWPASISQDLLVQGFSYSQQIQVIRTEMSAGPDFVRRRFTAASTMIAGGIYVTAAEHTIFWDFFNSTLHGGVDAFDWTHPITDAAASLRFVGVPTESPVGSGVLFQIQMQLEILP